MFYPPGLTVARKEHLSIIWLASNYDPEKYKKIIPPRECEKANIVRICASIVNPSVPYALRLSAQLLLGTVRVYRAKTKLILDMAEQMILKLSSLIRETSSNSYDMPVAMLRADAITIADTGMSIIDYSLEPVYYDPQMIMHMNEEDFITVQATPLQSPIKVEKKASSKKTIIAATPSKSPIVVNNSKISFQEDLLSPSRPIQVPPAADEFGTMGFGPAGEDFLNDLMSIAEETVVKQTSLKPKVLNFGSDDEEQKEKVLESVPEGKEVHTANGSSPLEIENAVSTLGILHGGTVEENVSVTAVANATTTLTLAPDAMVVSIAIADTIAGEVVTPTTTTTSTPLPLLDTANKRKHSEMELGGQPEVLVPPPSSNLDQLLKEATALADSATIHLDQSSNDVVNNIQGNISEQLQLPPQPPITGEAQVIEDLAEYRAEKNNQVCADDVTVVGAPGLPMDWEDNLQTPCDAIVLRPLPSQPKKKRKLMVDKYNGLTNEEMKSNFSHPGRLTKMPVVAGSTLRTAKDLFGAPVLACSNNQLQQWWLNNLTVNQPPDPLHSQEEEEDEEQVTTVVCPVSPEYEKEGGGHEKKDGALAVETLEENEQVNNTNRSPQSNCGPQVLETPSSIDILRAGSTSMKSFDKSEGYASQLIETPVVETSKTVDPNIERDLLSSSKLPQSPRISGIGLIPDENLEEPPELDVVLEQGEKSIDFVTELYEENPILNESYKDFQRSIFKSLNTSDQTIFQRLFPTSRTKRRDAALALYLTLNMHKNGYVELQQSELFGDLVIQRGRIS